MTTKKATDLTHEYPGVVQELLKPETFTSVSWWGELSRSEQNNVLRETLELGATLISWGEIKHKVGQHLANVQEVLAPHGKFDAYLRIWQRILNRSRRSLYRDIENYEKATDFPEQIAKAAAIKNFPIDKLKTVRKMLPVPSRIGSEADALAYIDKAAQFSKENPQIHEMDAPNIRPKVDAEELAKEAFVIFKNCLAKLPPRKRLEWTEHVIGMQMNVAGIQSSRSFKPEAVPAEYTRGRGRPPKAVEGEVVSA